MPKTTFKLIFETEVPDIDIDKFQKSLPKFITVYKKNDEIYVDVETTQEEDQNAQYLVERELDRVFFLTCVKIKAGMIKKTVCMFLDQPCRIHGDLPSDITPQNWSYELPIMLKLWSMAIDLRNEFILQILYYFQIIELAYPRKESYPEYSNPEIAPHPLTECKLIRHLIAHSGEVYGSQLKFYCEHIGLPEVMHDITDGMYKSILMGKVKLLENQAKKAIEIQL